MTFAPWKTRQITRSLVHSSEPKESSFTLHPAPDIIMLLGFKMIAAAFSGHESKFNKESSVQVNGKQANRANLLATSLTQEEKRKEKKSQQLVQFV